MYSFIEKNYLLSKEEIDLFSVKQENDITEIPIIKKTTRKIKKVGLLKCVLDYSIQPLEKELLTIFASTNVKKPLGFHPKEREWFHNGWILEEIRFKKDGISIEDVRYRIGEPVFLAIKENEKLKIEDYEKQLLQWKVQWQSINIAKLEDEEIGNRIVEWLGSFTNSKKLMNSEEFMSQWKFEKRLLFLHFVSAIFQLYLSQQPFDWKEIGATYYKKIGGSKKFDRHKEEFIDLIEKILDVPISDLGLRSLGVIVPLFFTGNLYGIYANYKSGCVHATTDDAVHREKFATDANVLWIVENRGVLTRMAGEVSFVEDTKSFIISSDGQIRSSHANFVKQLIKNSINLEKIIIWTDYDQAGQSIANGWRSIVERSIVEVKYVLPNGEVTKQFDDILETTVYIENKEQEEMLGGPNFWEKWINE